MSRWIVGPGLALSWLTVLPIRGPSNIDRDHARWAITSTPLVGLLLGLASSALLWGLLWLSIPGLLAGLLTVSALALLTRGMHIDGLADTADGLGCYEPPERAREVMRSGGAGPFGVATIALVLAGEAAAFGALADARSWWAIVIAVASGRVAVVLACRRGVSAAPGAGFGALVADSQSATVVAGWTGVTLLAAAGAVDGRWWQGPLVVALALAAAFVGVRHCARRFGGISGDVLGAVVESTTALVAIGLLLEARPA